MTHSQLGKDCSIQIVCIFYIAKIVYILYIANTAIFVQKSCMVGTSEQDIEA